MTRTDIINILVKKIAAYSYLEIGVRQGENFFRINCSNKVGVDPDPLSKATHIMTSDDFFKTNTSVFDVVFIDGLHLSEQVYRDIVNSLKCLAPGGYIVCHDMNPPSEELQVRSPIPAGNWNGDCWKAFVQLRNEREDLFMVTVDTDWGCGIIRRGLQDPIEALELTWANFSTNRKHWLNLVTEEEFNQMVKHGVL